MRNRDEKEDALFQQFEDLKDQVGVVLQEADVDIRMVITLLTYMLIDTAIYQAEIEPAVLIAKFAKNVNDVIALNERIEQSDNEEEDDEQIISRTTH